MLDSGAFPEFEVFLLSAGALVVLIVSLVACVCCYGKSFGFKEFSDSRSVSEEHHDGDFNVFTPQGTNRSSRESIKFDPLPDPSLLQADNVASLRPRIAPLNKERLGTEALLESFNYEFSRTQLQFIKEIGTGWFGKVLQGEAQKITVGLRKTKVVVKVLDMEASGQDKIDFLLDNSPYRELDHANVVRLLGQCTQAMPFLMIMEYFTLGDVKKYLLKRQNEVNNFSERRTLVKLACDMAAGLHCLHFHHFVHNDFSLRNCMVAMDLSVKVGDYGIAEDLYKDDYYGPDNNLVPIRWSAPETAQVIGDQVLIRNVTKEANVWSFGVTLWELMSLGEQPYPGMTNQDVIEQVLVKQKVKPSIPVTIINDKERMYEIMLLCMGEPSQRPTMAEAHKLLQHLQESPYELDEFDQKWNLLLPSIESAAEKLQAHGSPNFPMKFEDDGDHDVDDSEVVIEQSRLSFTQGFEIDSKTGFKENNDESNKMIMNPSFEDDVDDLTRFMDEASTPVASHDIIIDLSGEVEKDVAKIDMNGLHLSIDSEEETQKIQENPDELMFDDYHSRSKRDSFRTSVHMLVSKTPSEDHVEFDVLDIEKSNAESFVSADTSFATSPSKSQMFSSGSDDFVTPIGSLDSEAELHEIERSEEQLVIPGRERVTSWIESKVERSEDQLVMPGRERVISDVSESENDTPSPFRPTASTDSDQSSGLASERISNFLNDIQPPPFSPGESPGHDIDNDNIEFDFETSKDSSNDEDSPGSDKVVMRRKHGTAVTPSKRSGLVEDDDEIPESGFTHLKDIDANAHVHNIDTENLLDDDDSERVLVGTDGKSYRRRSSIRQPDPAGLSLPGNKKVSFTDMEHLAEIHSYPKDGSSSDQEGDDEADEAKPAYLSILESLRNAKVKKGSNESDNTANFFNKRGNRNAVIIDFDKPPKPDSEEDPTDSKPNDLDDDTAMLIM